MTRISHNADAQQRNGRLRIADCPLEVKRALLGRQKRKRPKKLSLKLRTNRNSFPKQAQINQTNEKTAPAKLVLLDRPHSSRGVPTVELWNRRRGYLFSPQGELRGKNIYERSVLFADKASGLG